MYFLYVLYTRSSFACLLSVSFLGASRELERASVFHYLCSRMAWPPHSSTDTDGDESLPQAPNVSASLWARIPQWLSAYLQKVSLPIFLYFPAWVSFVFFSILSHLGTAHAFLYNTITHCTEGPLHGRTKIELVHGLVRFCAGLYQNMPFNLSDKLKESLLAAWRKYFSLLVEITIN